MGSLCMSDPRTDPYFNARRALAQLALPALIRQALSELRAYHLVVINDARTSRIPWETINIAGWFPAAQTP